MKQVVYVASPESHQIHVWSMNCEGELSLCQTVDVSGQPQPMVLSHDGKYLYVGVRPNFRVITYQIEDNGSLVLKAETAIPGTPVHLSFDQSGRFLFVPSYHQNNLSVLSVDQQGIPSTAIQVIEGLKNPHSSHVDSDNKQLWVPCLGEDHIRLFNLAEDGRLTEASADQIVTQSGAGPRHLAFHPTHKVIYCVNELDSTVNVYHNFTRYREMQSVKLYPADFNSTPWASDIHITPDGRHLYVSERSESFISHFIVSDDGMFLTLAETYPTEKQPRGFNLDHSGRFLISSGQKSDHISVSRIDGISGKLAEIGRYPVGKGPMWVTILQK